MSDILEARVRLVEMVGGPPWGFRLGAFTTTTIQDGEGEEDVKEVVGAVKISRVNPESKASSAGIRDGDLLLSVNGEDIQAPGSGGESSGNNSSPAMQSQSPTDSHHKVMGQLQVDTVRLGILSKRSKKQALKKVIAKGEAEHAKGLTKPSGTSVTWADPEKRCVDTPSANPNTQIESETSHDENHRPGQEEVNKMQPQNEGLLLLRQFSSSSAPPANPPPPVPIPFYASSLLIKEEDLKQINGNGPDSNTTAYDKMEEEIPPVWSPPGVPPSPKLGKKFRPVNFNANNSSVPQSPVQVQSQNGIVSTPQSPGGVLSPPSEPSFSASNSFDNSTSRHLSSHSQSLSSGTTTSSNLPRYQSPTVVLLQKAREGQLPKGAAYLQQQQRFNGSSSADYSTSHRTSETNEPVIISYAENSRPQKPSRSISATEVINIPMTSKSTLAGEKEQREWYKKMYESLHVERKPSTPIKFTYPAGKIHNGPPARSFWAKRIHSSGTVSEPEDFEHAEEVEYDFNKFTTSNGNASGVRTIPPGAIRFRNPGRIEDYNPVGGNASTAARKQRYLRQLQPDLKKHWALSSPKSSGYDSDSNYIIRKKTEADSLAGFKSPELPPLSPAEQKHLYVEIQKGGEVPLQGLRKFVPGPGRGGYDDHGDGGILSPSQNIRYSESTVNIHYKAPIRIEEKEYVSEEELRRKQQQQMKRFYEEQRKLKFAREIEDMERRRHSDNFVASQKSPIPLTRYEDDQVIDGLIDNSPNRPCSAGLWRRTPEPSTPSRVTGPPLALARAKYNFTAQSPRELQLVKGDLVIIRKKIDTNWYEGEIRNPGKSSYFYPNTSSALGIFPCTYVEILPDDPKCTASVTKYSSSERPQEYEGLARVLYNFPASHSFELELVKGELVVLSRRVDGNWFEGRKQKKPHLSGIFPVSYVDVVKEIGAAGSKSPVKKPVGQPVAHSLNYGSDTDDFSLKKHHYKPNEFILQDESDYGEVFSPTPTKHERMSKSRKRMNQRLELITVDTRLNQDQPFRYRAIYNYKPVHSDELELNEGDIVDVMEKCDDGWFVGTSQRTGLFGTFPGNYVERIR